MTGPGFQMSFAATTALVAVFGLLRELDVSFGPRWLHGVAGVVISSAVAGLATAPVAAAHFNTLAHYGLIANLLSVPVMGILVIPAAVLAAVLAPFGLEMLGLVPMGWGLAWILGVAERVAGMDGAQGVIVSPGPWVLPVLALGVLWVILWQGRARWAGVVPMSLALVLWTQAERPEVLIAGDGGLVGVLTPEGRALSKARGSGFVAGVWLENDGDAAGQEEAAARWAGGTRYLRHVQVGPTRVVHVLGKRGAERFEGCATGDLVIASVPLTHTGCTIYDADRLQQAGSLALHNGKLMTARALSGQRIWNRPPPRSDRVAAARGDQ